MMSRQFQETRVIRVILRWAVGVVAVFLCILAAIRYWDEFTRFHAEMSVWMLIIGLGFMLGASLFKAAGSFVLMISLESPVRFLTALRAWSY